MIFPLILGGWLLLTIISSFINIKFFLCSYLAYLFLVPFMDLHFMGIPLGYNAVVTFSLIGFLIKNNLSWKNTDFKPLVPFLFLFGFQLLMIPFQSGEPIVEMLNAWRVDFMGTLFLPFMVWNGYKKDPTVLKPLRWTIIIVIVIICSYGLFLTSMPGLNPYLLEVLPLNGDKFNDAYALADNQGRMFGRISAVFGHPMTFGLFLCMTLVYLFIVGKKSSVFIVLILAPLTLLNALFCGVRSSLVGIAIAVVVYLIMSKKIKFVLFLIFGYYLILFVVQNIPGLEEYLGSIADYSEQNQTVGGSSPEMRYYQFLGAVDIVKECPVVGMGYNWTGYYYNLHGDHPVCLAFESLIYVILCDNGYLGFLIWGIMLLMIFFGYKYPDREIKNIIVTLVFSYIGYSCITGEYGYMRIMIVFYILILMESQKNIVKKQMTLQQ